MKLRVPRLQTLGPSDSWPLVPCASCLRAPAPLSLSTPPKHPPNLPILPFPHPVAPDCTKLHFPSVQRLPCPKPQASSPSPPRPRSRRPLLIPTLKRAFRAKFQKNPAHALSNPRTLDPLVPRTLEPLAPLLLFCSYCPLVPRSPDPPTPCPLVPWSPVPSPHPAR